MRRTKNVPPPDPDCPVVSFPSSLNYPKPAQNQFLDPFDIVLLPPEDETPQERELRLEREAEAKRISDQIDHEIKLEKESRKRGRRKIVRLLLLGQSESGKSTTLRQFQRLYTPTQFRAERVLWRAVIQLNIVRSILIILAALDNSPAAGPMPGNGHTRRLPSHSAQRSISSIPSPSHSQPSFNIPSNSNDDIRHDNFFQQNEGSSSGISASPPDTGVGAYPNPNLRRPSLPSTLPPEINALRPQLANLKELEDMLISRLSPDSPISQFQLPRGEALDLGEEFAIRVHPDEGFKAALERIAVQPSHHQLANLALSDDDESSGDDLANLSSGSGITPQRSDKGRKGKRKLDPNDPQSVLYALRHDMKALWKCQEVRDILERKKVRVWEEPGFFLNDLDRVTSLRFMPTDEDVLRARLKTVGVAEYKFEMEATAGRDSATEWRIVDVGGSRGQRPTWVPFFDDVDAIIFLAPISGFDQVLAEDKNVNRLEDSVLLWRALCSNKLLANVDLVLFLNKCDILERKLKNGVQLSRYLKSYGERPNDFDNVSKYLRSKFSAIQREYSPQPRKFYVWCTSVTDTATTAGIIAAVRDMVIRQHLKQSKLL